jgi:hypothetical protein
LLLTDDVRCRTARSPPLALAVDVFLQSQINAAVVAGVEQVIALVLGVMHAEMLLYVLGERMDLE